jgi:hypothetical protein
MNRRVILRSDSDEVFLGTVEEVLTGEGEGADGISLAAVLSDIVNDIAFNSEYDGRRFVIELRDPTVE